MPSEPTDIPVLGMILSIERLNSTANGNPMYRLHLGLGPRDLHCVTKPDLAVNETIDPGAHLGKLVYMKLDVHARITHYEVEDV